MSGKSRDGNEDEFAAIARFFKPLAGDDPTARRLDDDAAVLTPPPGEDLVFTKDVMVAGVHFLEDDPKDLVAQKLARVNLSDLASMGARPLGYLLSTALPREDRDAWLEGLSAGLGADQAAFGWTLWGGDTVSTPGPATFSLTAVGAVPHGRALSRAGASAGDLVFVSGSLGDGALGLLACKGELPDLNETSRTALEARFLLPSPRLDLGRELLGLATAAIDISDGLMADLGHICEASGVGATVREVDIPLSKAANAALAMQPDLKSRIFAGDDYELLFTAPEDKRAAVMAAAAAVDVPIAEIGRITAGKASPELVDETGTLVSGARPGYTHF